jgi:peptide deformylase
MEIVKAGEQVLRQVARELSREEILSEEIQKLIEDMKAAMRGAPGVGLAAPQVGIPLALAVIEDRQEYHAKLTDKQLAERNRRPIPFHVVINPKIIASGESSAEFFEGCLSVPGYAAIVPRKLAVTVEFRNEHAEAVRIDAAGWYARILQHEIDHLRGVLYTDRMHARTFSTLENLERLWRDIPVDAVKGKLS